MESEALTERFTDLKATDRMLQILSTIAICCAAAVIILETVDWLLSDSQKRILVDRSIRLWDWLDDTKRKRLLLEFRHRKPQVIVAILAQVGAIVILLVSMFAAHDATLAPSAEEWLIIAIILVGSAITVWVGTRWFVPSVLHALADVRNDLAYIVVIFGLIVGFNALVVPLVWGLDAFHRLWRLETEEPIERLLRLLAGDSSDTSINIAPLWVDAVFFGLASPLATAQLFVLLTFLITTFAVVGLSLTRVVMAVLEFAVRRTVEYPKGPVLGLSILIGAFGALIKVLH